ncbi:HAD family hydrolase [Actinoplanes sp. CA-030573]|uniref:HAD family hydrolase n=1 Tax=Actinoplanes sp. CA-030573 TaxID=3239898 RepID=UPI003D8ED418
MTAGGPPLRVLDGPLLLDFDGPVCAVFAGYPAERIAADLIETIARKSGGRGSALDHPPSKSGGRLGGREDSGPPDQRNAAARHPSELPMAERDPLAVLRWAGKNCARDTLIAVEEALSAAELRAVVTAEPTPHGHDLILTAAACGLPVAVVSNNSAPAIRAYLAAHGLATHIAVVVGRPYANPARMKPDPRPILEAARALDASPDACTFVGDSVTDVKAARAAGVRVVGYANRPAKLRALAGADAVVTSMGQLTVASRAPGRRAE